MKNPGCCKESEIGRWGQVEWREADNSSWSAGPYDRSGWCIAVWNPYTGMQSDVGVKYQLINYCPYCGAKLD